MILALKAELTKSKWQMVSLSHIYVQSSIVLFVPVFCLLYRIVSLHYCSERYH